MSREPGVSRSRYAGAIGLFILGATTQYLGAAIAVGLFAHLSALAVAWWRIALAALVLLAWRRPWRRSREWWWQAAGFGLVLAAMNVSFYVAIEHLPLGTAVSIEFLGPVAVAALAGHGWWHRVAIVLAAAGVATISGLGLDWGRAGTGVGLVFAALAGALWGLYVVLGRRLAIRVNGLDALAVGMGAGAVVFAPLATTTIASRDLLAGLLAVALLSSVIPYVFDQINFGVLPAATFAILLALLPATALVVGLVTLGQVPSAGELGGLVLVSLAVALANLPSQR